MSLFGTKCVLISYISKYSKQKYYININTQTKTVEDLPNKKHQIQQKKYTKERPAYSRHNNNWLSLWFTWHCL